MANPSNIPEIMVDFNVYNQAEKLIGSGPEIELPEFESITATVSGAGVMGEYETSAPGHFSSMEIEIPFRTITDEASSLNEPRRQQLVFRGSIQYYNRIRGINEHRPLKVVIAGKPKGLSPGKMIKSEQMEATAKIEIEYIKLETDGKTLVELDKLNSIYVVNGRDYYETIRNMI